MGTRKRKASASESEGSEEIAWLEKQNLPTGSSPVAWDLKYASSSDEEYEGFLHSDRLLLSDAGKSISDEAVVDFFQGFKCTVVSTEVGKDKKKTFAVKFSSAKSAVAALEKFKDLQLKGQTVSLTRSVDPKFKSFCIKGFKKNSQPNDIRQQVNNKFCQFGKILHIFFPSKEEDLVYLYMALKPEFTAERVVGVKGLQVRECQMKGKVTKHLLEKKRDY